VACTQGFINALIPMLENVIGNALEVLIVEDEPGFGIHFINKGGTIACRLLLV
jgi:hypothetical protein